MKLTYLYLLISYCWIRCIALASPTLQQSLLTWWKGLWLLLTLYLLNSLVKDFQASSIQQTRLIQIYIQFQNLQPSFGNTGGSPWIAHPSAPVYNANAHCVTHLIRTQQAIQEAGASIVVLWARLPPRMPASSTRPRPCSHLGNEPVNGWYFSLPLLSATLPWK